MANTYLLPGGGYAAASSSAGTYIAPGAGYLKSAAASGPTTYTKTLSVAQGAALVFIKAYPILLAATATNAVALVTTRLTAIARSITQAYAATLGKGPVSPKSATISAGQSVGYAASKARMIFLTEASNAPIRRTVNSIKALTGGTALDTVRGRILDRALTAGSSVAMAWMRAIVREFTDSAPATLVKTFVPRTGIFRALAYTVGTTRSLARIVRLRRSGSTPGVPRYGRVSPRTARIVLAPALTAIKRVPKAFAVTRASSGGLLRGVAKRVTVAGPSVYGMARSIRFTRRVISLMSARMTRIARATKTATASTALRRALRPSLRRTASATATTTRTQNTKRIKLLQFSQSAFASCAKTVTHLGRLIFKHIRARFAR